MNIEPQTTNPLEEFDLEELSFLDTIDHVLNKGMVISGEMIISVAKIDLVYLGLNVLLGSVEAIQQALDKRDTERNSGK
jgi:hypothetical protein